MAKRPIFRPNPIEFPYFQAIDVEFQWYPGFAKSQFQKSIDSLHQAGKKSGISPILEISGKSKDRLGVSLSAFHLKLQVPNGQRMSVECAYQGSKVFERGGPYRDLYYVSSREAKTDKRLRNSGELCSFDFFDSIFSTIPQTFFYDLLYLEALNQNPGLKPKLQQYKGFSDIVYNPQRSFGCQARTAALYVSLSQQGLIRKKILQEVDYYKDLLENKFKSNGTPYFSQMARYFETTDEKQNNTSSSHTLPR